MGSTHFISPDKSCHRNKITQRMRRFLPKQNTLNVVPSVFKRLKEFFNSFNIFLIVIIFRFRWILHWVLREVIGRHVVLNCLMLCKGNMWRHCKHSWLGPRSPNILATLLLGKLAKYPHRNLSVAVIKLQWCKSASHSTAAKVTPGRTRTPWKGSSEIFGNLSHFRCLDTKGISGYTTASWVVSFWVERRYWECLLRWVALIPWLFSVYKFGQYRPLLDNMRRCGLFELHCFCCRSIFGKNVLSRLSHHYRKCVIIMDSWSD